MDHSLYLQHRARWVLTWKDIWGTKPPNCCSFSCLFQIPLDTLISYHLNIYWTSVTCIWSTSSAHHNNLYILLLFLSSSFFHIPEGLKPCPSHSAISCFLSIPIPIKFFSSLCFLIGKTVQITLQHKNKLERAFQGIVNSKRQLSLLITCQSTLG